MENKFVFDYYYGAESEQFSFFRVPKVLFTDKKFRGISSDAKILYGMMLDRMSLSRQNGWIDDENRVYIIYTLAEIMEDLDCGKDKGVHLIAELDERGIGLIERRKQGFGKPALIYVKNFIACYEKTVLDAQEEGGSGSNEEEDAAGVDGGTGYGESEHGTAQTLENSGFYQTSEKPKSLGAICRSREFGKTEVKSSEKPKSRLLENRSQDFGKTEVSNTDNNNTNNSNTDSSNTNTYINPPLSPPFPEESALPDEEGSLESDTLFSNVLEYVKQNIEYDRCMQEVKTESGRKIMEFVLELICDVISHPRTQIRIGGITLPYQNVRKRFLELTAEQVLYVVDCMQSAAKRIKHSDSYAITVLYNAVRSTASISGDDATAGIQPISSTRFQEFWQSYPLQVREIETEKEYSALLTKGIAESDLVEAAKNYAEEVSILQAEKLCYPANFLGKGIYKDYIPGKYKPPQNRKRQRMFGQERSYSKDEMAALEQALLERRPEDSG